MKRFCTPKQAVGNARLILEDACRHMAETRKKERGEADPLSPFLPSEKFLKDIERVVLARAALERTERYANEI